MSIDHFNTLPKKEQLQIIAKTSSIAQSIEAATMYKVYNIANFFVEVSTQIEGTVDKIIKAYTLQELPAKYATQLIQLPLVTLSLPQAERPKYNEDHTSNCCPG